MCSSDKSTCKKTANSYKEHFFRYQSTAFCSCTSIYWSVQFPNAFSSVLTHHFASGPATRRLSLRIPSNLNCILTLEPLGFEPFYLHSTFYTSLPGFLRNLELFLECLFRNSVALPANHLSTRQTQIVVLLVRISASGKSPLCNDWQVRRLGDERRIILLKKVTCQKWGMSHTAFDRATIFLPLHKLGSCSFLNGSLSLFTFR